MWLFPHKVKKNIYFLHLSSLTPFPSHFSHPHHCQQHNPYLSSPDGCVISTQCSCLSLAQEGRAFLSFPLKIKMKALKGVLSYFKTLKLIFLSIEGRYSE